MSLTVKLAVGPAQSKLYLDIDCRYDWWSSLSRAIFGQIFSDPGLVFHPDLPNEPMSCIGPGKRCDGPLEWKMMKFSAT